MGRTKKERACAVQGDVREKTRPSFLILEHVLSPTSTSQWRERRMQARWPWYHWEEPTASRSHSGEARSVIRAHTPRGTGSLPQPCCSGSSDNTPSRRDKKPPRHQEGVGPVAVSHIHWAYPYMTSDLSSDKWQKIRQIGTISRNLIVKVGVNLNPTPPAKRLLKNAKENCLLMHLTGSFFPSDDSYLYLETIC